MRNSLYLVLTLITLAVLFTCEDNQQNEDGYNICGVTNPEWFMALIEEVESDSMLYFGSVIYRCTYSGDYYFYLDYPLSSCAYCRLYDCDGDLVVWADNNERNDFLEYKTDEKIIWRLGDWN